MDFEHSFTIPVPTDKAWNVLLDVERVAPCMPGATVDSVVGDDIGGHVRVKVGPITMTYAGRARFLDRDPVAHTVTLEASGKESRGTGTASATVRAALSDDNGQTGHTQGHHEHNAERDRPTRPDGPGSARGRERQAHRAVRGQPGRSTVRRNRPG